MDFVNPYTIIDIPLLELLRNLAVGLVIAVVWAFVIGRSTRLVVDTRQYLPMFLLLIPAMILIITIIKTSIALSLGLVGALSIVRFRTPIKEPEELLYIFIAIAVGLGLGANQVVPTVLSFGVIAAALVPFALMQRNERTSASSLIDVVVYNDEDKQANFVDIDTILKEQNFSYKVKRVFETDGRIEVLVDVGSLDARGLEALRSSVSQITNRLELSMTDNARVIT